MEMHVDREPGCMVGRSPLDTHGRVLRIRWYFDRQFGPVFEGLQLREERRKSDGRDLFEVLKVRRQGVEEDIVHAVPAVARVRRIRRLKNQVLSQGIS